MDRAVSALSRASGTIPWRLLIAAATVVVLAAAVVSIRDTLLVVFLGVFGALVFEVPLRAFMRWTKLGRGLSGPDRVGQINDTFESQGAYLSRCRATEPAKTGSNYTGKARGRQAFGILSARAGPGVSARRGI